MNNSAFESTIIVLGGYVQNPQVHEETLSFFKDKGASIIGVDRHRPRRNPFTCYTASIKQAVKQADDGKKLVVISSCWIDDLVLFLQSPLDDDQLRLYTSWLINSRVLDRVAMRYGLIYCVNSYVATRLIAPFPDFLGRPDVNVSIRDLTVLKNQQELVRSVYPQVAKSSSMNLNGSLGDAKFLVVGEKIRPYFRHFDHWPWHHNQDSAFYFTSILHRFGLSERLFCWANACHPDVDVIDRLVNERPSLSIISLGHKASEVLKDRGHTISLQAYHPSFVVRFAKQKQYEQQLRTFFDNS